MRTMTTIKRICADSFNDGILLGSISCFLGLLGASLTFPFLQAQRDKLGCDALCYGTMQSARSGLSMLGTFLVGRLSDRMGRSQALWLGTVSSLFSLCVNVSGNSIMWMWISMIPASLLNQNFSVMKALFADYSTDYGYNESQRASAIGRLGMSAGLSFMIGPVVGASLFHNYSQATIAAFILTIFSSLILLNLPTPNTAKNERKSLATERRTKALSFTFAAIKTQIIQFIYFPAIQTTGAKLLLLIRFCMSLAFNIFIVVWTVSLKARFSFGPKDHAYFMGWIGLWYAISQGFLAKWFISLAGKDPSWMLQICVLCLSIGRVLAMMTSSLTIVYFIMAIVIIALGIMNTAISIACTHLAGKDQMGGLYGIFEATESFGGIIGPTLGGVLQKAHHTLPLVSVVFIYGIVFVVLTCYYEKHILLALPPAPLPSSDSQLSLSSEKEEISTSSSTSSSGNHSEEEDNNENCDTTRIPFRSFKHPSSTSVKRGVKVENHLNEERSLTIKKDQ